MGSSPVGMKFTCRVAGRLTDWPNTPLTELQLDKWQSDKSFHVMTFGIPISSKHHDVIFSGTQGEPVSDVKDSSLYFCLLCVSSYPRRPSGGLKGHVEVSHLILQKEEKRRARVASLAPGHLSFYRQNIESHLVFSQPSVKMKSRFGTYPTWMESR